VEAKVDQREQAPLLTVYGLLGNSGAIKLAAFNKHADGSLRLAIDAGRRTGRATALRLHAPRVDDTTDTTFGGAPVGASGTWPAATEETLSLENGSAMIELPAAGAALISFERE
jgi:hypothetical protein